MRSSIRGMALVTAGLLCLFPLSTATSTDSARREAGQDLQISMSGGLGINITVTNIGDHPVENLSWTVSLSGLIFGGISRDSGYDPVLEPGESFSTMLLVFGIGPGSLIMEVNDAVSSADVWFVGPFVFGV